MNAIKLLSEVFFLTEIHLCYLRRFLAQVGVVDLKQQREELFGEGENAGAAKSTGRSTAASSAPLKDEHQGSFSDPLPHSKAAKTE